MKHLKEFITEAIRITPETRPHKEGPKSKRELRDIIEGRLREDVDADLNDIDVSEIKYMMGLFEDLDPHNIKIDGWDVSNVIDMTAMFRGCKNFEGNGLEKWKLTKLKFASNMFKYCKNFNADLSSWDWKNVWANNAFLGCIKMKPSYFPKWYV